MNQRSLDTLARTLARKFSINVVANETSQDIGAYTDKKTIYLNVPPDMDPSIARGLLDHEIGHILFDSDNEVAKDIRIRYGNQGVSMLKMFEDIRVNNSIRGKFPGSKVNLKALMDSALEEVKNSTTEVSSQAIVGMLARGEGMKVPEWISDEAKEIVSQYEKEVAEAAQANNTRECGAIVERILQEIEQQEEQQEQPRLQEQQDNNSQEEESDEEEEEGECNESDEQGKEKEESRKPIIKDEETALNVDEDISRALKESSSFEEAKETAMQLEKVKKKDSPLSYYVPKDVKKHRDVYVTAEGSGSIRQFLSTSGIHRIPANSRKIVQVLQGKEKSWWLGERERGAVDQKSLPKFLTNSSTTVFKERMQERQRPSAVGLSIDLSGSMRGDKMRTVMCSSYLLADALDKAGVRFGAYGWSDTATGEDNQGLEFLSETEEKGYSSCRTRGLKHLKFKGFDEPLRKVKDRFSYLHAIRYTPMAEGMWYTAQKLLARPEERKILVVFGDGEPSKMTPYEDPIENVRSVIEKCESMGIEVILIGIMDKAMEEIRKDLTVRVRDIKQLQKTLFSEVYKKLKNNTKTVRRGQHVKN